MSSFIYLVSYLRFFSAIFFKFAVLLNLAVHQDWTAKFSLFLNLAKIAFRFKKVSLFNQKYLKIKSVLKLQYITLCVRLKSISLEQGEGKSFWETTFASDITNTKSSKLLIAKRVFCFMFLVNIELSYSNRVVTRCCNMLRIYIVELILLAISLNRCWQTNKFHFQTVMWNAKYVSQ